ncbi:hypothetical protein [Lysobacter soli]|uniref:hypothetical protein n=1 Tax=Lysobacter soli TaxID=453783 RepID=UPI001E4AD519|nr:hypothetical protein [Lysobacter soli]
MLGHLGIQQPDDLLAAGVVRVRLAALRQLDEWHLRDFSALPRAVQGGLADAQHAARVPIAVALLAAQPPHEVLLPPDRHLGHRGIRPEVLAPQCRAALGDVFARQLGAVLVQVARQHRRDRHVRRRLVLHRRVLDVPLRERYFRGFKVSCAKRSALLASIRVAPRALPDGGAFSLLEPVIADAEAG